MNVERPRPHPKFFRIIDAGWKRGLERLEGLVSSIEIVSALRIWLEIYRRRFGKIIGMMGIGTTKW
jgi:hypothetical protein